VFGTTATYNCPSSRRRGSRHSRGRRRNRRRQQRQQQQQQEEEEDDTRSWRRLLLLLLLLVAVMALGTPGPLWPPGSAQTQNSKQGPQQLLSSGAGGTRRLSSVLGLAGGCGLSFMGRDSRATGKGGHAALLLLLVALTSYVWCGAAVDRTSQQQPS
jgi:hypothetical protein